MLRPQPCDWFEILVPADGVATVLPRLAQHQLIEMERQELPPAPFTDRQDTRTGDALARISALADRYREWLPAPLPDTGTTPPLREGLPRIAAALEQWDSYAAKRIERQRQLDTGLEELDWLERCLRAVPGLELRFYTRDPQQAVVPWIAWLPGPPDPDLTVSLADSVCELHDRHDDGGAFILGMTLSPAMADVERALHGARGRFLRIPDWLRDSPGADHAALDQYRLALRRERAGLVAELDRRAQELELPVLLFLLRRYRWLQERMPRLWQGDRLVLITGWVPRRSIERLEQALATGSVPYLLYTDADCDRDRAPLVFDNPAWARRFQMFVQGFGMPARNDVDPSVVLALCMPLMFGYMFGDVGQGLVLMLAGLLLRQRFPVMGLFVPAGACAIGFGFLFGSVFANEHLLVPLWLHALDEPLTVMAVPLLFGAALVLLSMLFGALQASWQGLGARWWSTQFPLIPLAAGAGLSLVDGTAAGLLLAAAGVLFFGAAALHGWREQRVTGMLRELAIALPELLESFMQLAINTLSFARVGAFALAHAGLSSAIMALAELPSGGPAQVLVLVLGNLVVILLEGLIVSIQTTRLVMFEFFRRFLHGGGRPFRALEAEGIM